MIFNHFLENGFREIVFGKTAFGKTLFVKNIGLIKLYKTASVGHAKVQLLTKFQVYIAAIMGEMH